MKQTILILTCHFADGDVQTTNHTSYQDLTDYIYQLPANKSLMIYVVSAKTIINTSAEEGATDVN